MVFETNHGLFFITQEKIPTFLTKAHTHTQILHTYIKIRMEYVNASLG